MKNLLVVIIVMLCAFVNVFGQCSEIIHLKTQEDIDNFPQNYGCAEIFASLVIGDTTDPSSNITNLEGLKDLVRIEVNLIIYDVADLLNFSGLENLESIGNYFAVLNNINLKNFVGLENLKSIGGDFATVDNANLENFVGLENLESIGASLTVHTNENLENFVGLENLGNIGVFFDVYENPNLINFTGLENLETGIDIYVLDKIGLISLQGLENAIFTGIVAIGENPNLEMCCPMLNWDFSIVGTFLISGNNGAGCNSVEAVHALCSETAVQAQAFHDINENGTFDAAEQYLEQKFHFRTLCFLWLCRRIWDQSFLFNRLWRLYDLL